MERQHIELGAGIDLNCEGTPIGSARFEPTFTSCTHRHLLPVLPCLVLKLALQVLQTLDLVA
jgi:hypothetical protein